MIDSFDLEKYKLIPLQGEKGYKKVVRHMRIEEEMRRMEEEILATEGTKRFGNKFKTSDHDAHFK